MFDSSNGNYDIQKEHVNNKGVIVITAGATNNGILGKTDVKAKVFNAGTITIDMFGMAFYRNFEYKMVTHARVFSLSPNFKMTENQGLFISSALGFIYEKFGFDNMCTWEKIKSEYVKLPITSECEIDFDFMESFIAELETERVAELEAYLSVTGLKDYTLTEEENEVLQRFKKNKINFSEFAYKEIFNKIVQGRRLKIDDQLPGNIPFVMSGTTNNGVVNYVSNPVAFFPNNSITVDIFGNAFYRNYNFGAGDDTGVYWNTNTKYSIETMLFLTTAMEKSIAGKFSYGKKLRSSQSYDICMKLPSINGKPDFTIMDTLVSAIQKLVIKDVVLYSDRKMKYYKKQVE